MKTLRRLSTILFLLCLARITMAQDVIVMKDQSTVKCKVLEINNTEIKYKKWDNQDGPTYYISPLEVSKINYENGEVETFSEATNNRQDSKPQQTKYLNSYMTKSWGRLCLNGRPLSDHEIQSLVGQGGYQQYLKGRKLKQTGIVLDAIGGVALLVELAMKLFDDDYNTTDPSVIGTPAFKTHMTIYAIGVASLGAGILSGLFGGDKIEEVAETYNKNHGNYYSFNISPSMMNCETPQSQGNYGLGLTLSMNF